MDQTMAGLVKAERGENVRLSVRGQEATTTGHVAVQDNGESAAHEAARGKREDSRQCWRGSAFQAAATDEACVHQGPENEPLGLFLRGRG